MPHALEAKIREGEGFDFLTIPTKCGICVVRNGVKIRLPRDAKISVRVSFRDGGIPQANARAS